MSWESRIYSLTSWVIEHARPMLDRARGNHVSCNSPRGTRVVGALVHRFRSSKQCGAGERVTPPESPPEWTALHIRRAQRAQRRLVSLCRADVGDDDPASRFQNSERFADSLLTTLSRSDVMNRE